MSRFLHYWQPHDNMAHRTTWFLGLGKLYRRMRQREQAREHLAIATTMYREMGMTYWLGKAETEIQDASPARP